MKKGDIKKQEILKTAEGMFCKNGYETTSIQDILDVLNTSKGSFYHHYASKAALLEEICDLRARIHFDHIIPQIRNENSASYNLNLLLSGIMPLAGEKLNFLLMLLPVFTLPEGRQIRSAYAESLFLRFNRAVIQEIIHGNQTGEFFCTHPEHTASVCILLINDLWLRLSDTILDNEQKGNDTETSDLLNITDPYRMTLERILSARTGTITLIGLSELRFLTDQIHYHLKNPKK